MTQTTEFDPKAFRRALGNFATGITVITATAPNGEKVGVTANSFNSVSLVPALILWSIDKRSGSLPVFEAATHFAVNILAADQIHLSNQFARPSDDKFANIAYTQGAGGAAILDDCAATFECEKYQIVEGGDHWILIGKVVAFNDIGRAPLLYHQGSYAVSLPHTLAAGKDGQQSASVQQVKGRLKDNCYYLMTQGLRAYQADYQPRQQATGLRITEARILMVMEKDQSVSIDTLVNEVNMPRSEVETACEILIRKELLGQTDAAYQITAKGITQAEALFELADEQQQRMFANVSRDDLDAFKRVLKSLIE
jgi:flavin reductase (DIM6/NTAB) family NADH-FMN oxidoreductase RutF/DNA-binding MarR family transcriptional regulator